MKTAIIILPYEFSRRVDWEDLSKVSDELMLAQREIQDWNLRNLDISVRVPLLLLGFLHPSWVIEVSNYDNSECINIEDYYNMSNQERKDWFNGNNFLELTYPKEGNPFYGCSFDEIIWHFQDSYDVISRPHQKEFDIVRQAVSDHNLELANAQLQELQNFGISESNCLEFMRLKQSLKTLQILLKNKAETP